MDEKETSQNNNDHISQKEKEKEDLRKMGKFLQKFLPIAATYIVGIVGCSEGIESNNGGGFIAAAVCFSTLAYLTSKNHNREN